MRGRNDPDAEPGVAEENARGGGIQALDSALVALKALASFPGPTSLSDIARAADMPASKVHRYLASFIKAGLVRQAHRAGLYDLGKGAAALGLAAVSRMDLVAAAADRLEELVEETGAAGLVAVWGPHGPTLVRWRRTGSFVITSLGIGTIFPMLNSSTGRTFLAFTPRSVVAPLLDREIARAAELGLAWPDLDPREPDDVERLVAKVRADGHASVDGRFIPGLNAISAPVLNWQGEADAAVTLTASDNALLRPDGPALRRLKRVCAELSLTPRG